jgi:hypothetical protein
VIDAVAEELIERQIARDGRSLLQYVGESAPYTPARSEQAHVRIAEMAREEQEAIGRLIRFMQRHHVSPPVLGAFPSHFTTINFVALDFLLPALLKEQKFCVSDLERSLAALPEGETRRLLWDYLEMKRRHLHAFEEMRSVAHAH